ncbi:MAG: hypothetical protein HYY16_03590 [Planctomycetes bacterium]|nr:hypothetical protein [Planctomycetota bacterium]
MSDPCFAVFRGRRRRFVTGAAPAGVGGDRAVRARDWLAYQNRMSEEPPWERAERYRRLMGEKGYKSIRELARAIAEDHSRIARVLKVLDLPEAVLTELRKHSTNVRVRAHFTEKRLRQMVMKQRSEAAILREIQRALRPEA